MRTSTNKTLFLNAAALMLASVLLMAVVSADAATVPAPTATTSKTATGTPSAETGSQEKTSTPSRKKNAPKKKSAQTRPAAKPTTAVNSKTTATPSRPTKNQAQLSAAQKIAPTLKKTAPTTTAADSGASSATDAAPSLQAAVSSPAPTPPKKRWSVMAALQRSHNVYEEEMGTRKELDDFLSDITYKVTDTITALMEITWERDTQTGESDFGDTFLQIARKGYAVTKSLTLGPKAYYIVPNSKTSKAQNSNGGAGAGLTLGFAEGALPTGLTVIADINLTRFLQEYETTEEGKILNQYSSRQRLLYEYDFSVFEISGAIYHKSSQNYAGTINEVYGHAEEIGYRATRYLTLAIGHSLDGSMQKPNGIDSNIYFVSKADSMYYGSMTVSF